MFSSQLGSSMETFWISHYIYLMAKLSLSKNFRFYFFQIILFINYFIIFAKNTKNVLWYFAKNVNNHRHVCPFWKIILKISYNKSLGCYTKLKLCFSSVAACAYFSRVSINDFFIMLSPMLNSWDDGQSLSQILKWTVICIYCLIKSEKWKTSN